jgi:hypothetical protein
MAITNDQIENWFTYHEPAPEDILGYKLIRDAAKSLARIIVDSTPPSADQTAAIRLLRECVMTANAAIACKGN